MARFYGWTDREISDMDVHTFAKYYNSIESLSAREMADWFTVSMYPHLKSNRRQEIFNRIRRKFDKVIQKSTELADFGKTMQIMKGFMKSGRR